MSWEDCGFKPGKIYGPDTCRQCGECDGKHHFYVGCADSCLDDNEERPELPEGLDPEMFFQCKHCGVFAEAVDDDSIGGSA